MKMVEQMGTSKPGGLSAGSIEILMQSSVGRAWARTMHAKHPIGVTGHEEFDKMLAESEEAATSAKKNKEAMNKELEIQSSIVQGGYEEVTYSALKTGDVVQYRDVACLVLAIDVEGSTAEVYVWVQQGVQPSQRSRRKCFQGRRAATILTAKREPPVERPLPAIDRGPDVTEVTPAEEAGFNDE